MRKTKKEGKKQQNLEVSNLLRCLRRGLWMLNEFFVNVIRKIGV